MHFIEQSKFMAVTSLLKFIPASFLIKIVKRNKFCCSCSYSGCLDLYFF